MLREHRNAPRLGLRKAGVVRDRREGRLLSKECAFTRIFPSVCDAAHIDVLAKPVLFRCR
jgi:hypothetical protein